MNQKKKLGQVGRFAKMPKGHVSKCIDLKNANCNIFRRLDIMDKWWVKLKERDEPLIEASFLLHLRKLLSYCLIFSSGLQCSLKKL